MPIVYMGLYIFFLGNLLPQFCVASEPPDATHRRHNNIYDNIYENTARSKMAKMGSSINSNFQKLLNCNWILYVVFFLAASDLYIFAVNGELFYVSLFVLIGILTTFFSKNMTVILLIAMTLTNILRFGKDVRVKEGMEDGADTEGGAADPDIQTEKGDDYQFLEKKETGGAGGAVGASPAKAPPAKKPAIIESLTQDSSAAAAPAAVAGDASGELNLDNLKLEDLDQDTRNLLQKQKSLMTSMRTLEPMLTKAESFLEKFKNM